MHLKVLWTALNVFSMHLGGNRHWMPLSFENNNNKKDIAHIFLLYHIFSCIFYIFSCIADARFCLCPGRKILVLLHQFGQHTVEYDVVLERTVYLINLSK